MNTCTCRKNSRKDPSEHIHNSYQPSKSYNRNKVSKNQLFSQVNMPPMANSKKETLKTNYTITVLTSNHLDKCTNEPSKEDPSQNSHNNNKLSAL
jgi:hypothetical protein